MLNDISLVKTWIKVNEGLFKMYRAEVLGKLPIMQHFLFGKLISFVPSTPKSTSGDVQMEEMKMGGVHVHSIRGDCCGNPIPSVFAAAQEQERKYPSTPFD